MKLVIDQTFSETSCFMRDAEDQGEETKAPFTDRVRLEEIEVWHVVKAVYAVSDISHAFV
jgi:hypothetical protein